MNQKTNWLVELSEDDTLWSRNMNEDSVWPAPIVFNYNRLRNMMSEGNVYGALLQVKDLYEIILKIPVITALIFLDAKYEDELLDKTDIIETLMKKRFALGDWDTVANKLISHNKKDENDKKKKHVYMLPSEIVQIINNTQDLFRKRVGTCPNVMKWRNESIGHGMLKFEDDEDYKEEFKALISNLKDYFDGSSNDSYKNVQYYYGDVAFIGNNKPVTDGSHLLLNLSGDIVEVEKYTIRSFFLDSFRYDQREVKYLDYYSGKDDIERIEIFSNYVAKYDERKDYADRTLVSDRVLDSEEKIYSCLNMPEKYIVPSGLRDKLKCAIDDLDKGVITICMERGTGKTAFAYSVDGLYGRVGDALFDRAIVRTYSIGNLMTRGINDFFGYINFAFTKTRDDVSRDSDKEFPRISIKDDNPKKSMAAVLNAYRDYYEDTTGYDTLILIVDGIDELSEKTDVIRKWLLDSEDDDLLDDGVYIIYTTRFEDECSDSDFVRKNVEDKINNSDSLIEIRKNDETNIELLKEYIKSQKKGLDDEIVDDLILKSDYRFLYLKIYMNIDDFDVFLSVKDLVRKYMDKVFSNYNIIQKNIAIRFLVCLASYGKISLQYYSDFFSIENITYRFIGIINDIQPILTSIGEDDGRQYQLANVEYVSYIKEEYTDYIIEFGKRLQDVLVSKFYYLKNISYSNWMIYENDFDMMFRILETISELRQVYSFEIDSRVIILINEILRFFGGSGHVIYNIIDIKNRILDSVFDIYPCISGFDNEQVDLYLSRNIIDNHYSLLLLLYKRDKVKFKKMINIVCEEINNESIQWNILIENDKRLDSKNIAYSDTMNKAYELISSKYTNRINDILAQTVPKKYDYYEDTYINLLQHFLDKPISTEQRERLLNIIAFSCFVGTDKYAFGKKCFDTIKNEGLRIVPPFDGGDWTEEYNRFIEYSTFVNNANSKREKIEEVEADNAFYYHYELINNYDEFEKQSSKVKTVLARCYGQNYIESGMISDNTYIKNMTISILKLYFDKVDELLLNKTKITYDVRNGYLSNLKHVKEVFGEKCVDKLLVWLEGFKQEQFYDRLILMYLYYDIIEQLGEDKALKYLEEYVYSLDAYCLTYLFGTARMWNNDPGITEGLIKENMIGRVICSSESVKLMSAYHALGNREKTEKVCADIIKGDNYFWRMIKNNSDILYLLDYQKYRLLFISKCHEFGFWDYVDTNMDDDMTFLLDKLIQTLNKTTWKSNDANCILWIDEFFYWLFRFDVYEINYTFECINSIREVLNEIKEKNGNSVLKKIQYYDIYLDAIETLFNSIKEKKEILPGEFDDVINQFVGVYDMRQLGLVDVMNKINNGDVDIEHIKQIDLDYVIVM